MTCWPARRTGCAARRRPISNSSSIATVTLAPPGSRAPPRIGGISGFFSARSLAWRSILSRRAPCRPIFIDGIAIARGGFFVKQHDDAGGTHETVKAASMHEHARSAGPVHDHRHDHDPRHDPRHDHRHAPVDFGQAIAIGAALNLSFVAVEASYGVLANSLALLADAGHNLGDVLGLLLAWGATHLVKRAPTRERTYGYKRSSIAAALGNAIILLITVGAIALEAIRRLAAPEESASDTVIVVAAIGILVNALTAWLFMAGPAAPLPHPRALLHQAGGGPPSARLVVARLILPPPR